MAKPRLKPSGKWEIGLRHPSLPNGRKYFTFETEAEAIAYGQQWKLMKHADIPPPAELTTPTSPGDGVRISPSGKRRMGCFHVGDQVSVTPARSAFISRTCPRNSAIACPASSRIWTS